MAQPRILQFPGDLDRLVLPVGAAVAIETGDLISLESNSSTLLDADTDDATFVGFAISQHTANVAMPATLLVGLKGILLFTVTSASYGFGAGLKYTSENTLVADGGANTIAWSGEEATTVTSLKTIIDVIAMNKLFAVDA